LRFFDMVPTLGWAAEKPSRTIRRRYPTTTLSGVFKDNRFIRVYWKCGEKG
jgi:hypothetical protein